MASHGAHKLAGFRRVPGLSAETSVTAQRPARNDTGGRYLESKGATG